MLPNIPDLRTALWHLVAQIPRGCVVTYGDVARALGDVAASRYVGREMLNHEHGRDCRCHRLVRADGSLGKFVTGAVEEKRGMLAAEGIEVACDRVDLPRFRFTGLSGPRPLEKLSDFQSRVALEVQCTGSTHMDRITRVAGVDVSFIPSSQSAVAAYVEMELASDQPEYRTVVQARAEFPYISSYLAFRELPLHLALIQCVREERGRLADVIMVDGSGILHPRRAGIATMLGLAAQAVTIGITKKRLVGSFGEQPFCEGPTEILQNGEVCGFALRPKTGSARPLYVSPGHQVSPSDALVIVQRTLRNRRLPDPIYWADRISRSAARSWGCDAARL